MSNALRDKALEIVANASGWSCVSLSLGSQCNQTQSQASQFCQAHQQGPSAHTFLSPPPHPPVPELMTLTSLPAAPKRQAPLLIVPPAPKRQSPLLIVPPATQEPSAPFAPSILDYNIMPPHPPSPPNPPTPSPRSMGKCLMTISVASDQPLSISEAHVLEDCDMGASEASRILLQDVVEVVTPFR